MNYRISLVIPHPSPERSLVDEVYVALRPFVDDIRNHEADDDGHGGLSVEYNPEWCNQIVSVYSVCPSRLGEPMNALKQMCKILSDIGIGVNHATVRIAYSEKPLIEGYTNVCIAAYSPVHHGDSVEALDILTRCADANPKLINEVMFIHRVSSIRRITGYLHDVFHNALRHNPCYLINKLDLAITELSTVFPNISHIHAVNMTQIELQLTNVGGVIVDTMKGSVTVKSTGEPYIGNAMVSHQGRRGYFCSRREDAACRDTDLRSDANETIPPMWELFPYAWQFSDEDRYKDLYVEYLEVFGEQIYEEYAPTISDCHVIANMFTYNEGSHALSVAIREADLRRFI